MNKEEGRYALVHNRKINKKKRTENVQPSIMLLNWKVNTNEALASKQSGLAIFYDLKRAFIPAEPIMS